MLGARTKQIYSYGKRNKRIVSLPENQEMKFDDIEPLPRAPIVSRMKKRAHMVHAKSRTPSPKVVHVHRKKKLPNPTVSPSAKFARLAELLDGETIKAIPKSKSDALMSEKSAGTPSRAPLASFSLNTPGTPTVSRKLTGPKPCGNKGIPSKLKSFSPFVDVDITVLDDNGRTVRQERRVSRTDVQSNPVNETVRKPFRRPSRVCPVFEENIQDDEEIFQLKRPKRSAKRAVITVESDTEDEDVAPVAQRRSLNTPISQDWIPIPAVSQPLPSCSHMSGPSRVNVEVEVLIPPPPYTIKRTTLASINSTLPIVEPSLSQLHYLPPSPPLIRPRRLTPIRRRGGQNIFNPVFPPSPSLTSTDLDLSFDLEDLNIIGVSLDLDASQIPDYLKPLLAECGQSACGPIEFSSFIETFAYDPVVQSIGGSPADLRFRKIGEASYSEVFGIGDVVLKVIPLRNESDEGTPPASAKDMNEDDVPAPTDAKDVLKEIIVTEAMGQVCAGFVKLLKTYVVRGKYPEVLLRLWDEYHASKGSESVRPDKFFVSQVYAIIVLPNGGPDLEAYKFLHPNKMGWRQASSIFWQVAKSLAHAEQLVSFEHRDLHLGQILVKDLPVAEVLPLQAWNQNVQPNSKPSRVYMDDPVHGVRATLIDLGLSRMDAGDGDGGEMIHWTPFEDELFMGEGDYQFDVYRMMKEHNQGTWEEFKPLTNVMWLHYLVVKLMKVKRLRAPAASRTSPSTGTAAFTEKDCYDCLVDIEEWLRTCVAPFVPKAKGKGRKKAAASIVAPPSGPACAGEVVAYAVKKGWVQPVV
ncbi:Serine/threonine-protein kinase haspin [Termitomyces sp. T112]|nr:Serine/threonine-protein kinase haspin [Termitomyces sp. T112]KNZ77183.1 Serine/threonine-protein kinase haspin [Termitomyces sp. J132]